MSAYVLEVNKRGSKLSRETEVDKDAAGPTPGVRIQRGPHIWLRLIGVKASMPELAAGLQRMEMDRPVVDHTGLKNRFNFTLTATSIKPFFAGETADAENPPPELFTAIRQQLGLRLATAKTPLPCLVLDQI